MIDKPKVGDVFDPGKLAHNTFISLKAGSIVKILDVDREMWEQNEENKDEAKLIIGSYIMRTLNEGSNVAITIISDHEEELASEWDHMESVKYEIIKII